MRSSPASAVTNRALLKMLLACCAFATAFLQAANAQTSRQTTASPSTIVGVVTDTSGMPLQDVDVTVVKLQRSTRTRPDGTFRFEAVPAGTYEVRARGVGYLAPTQTAVVGKDGAAVNFRMIRYGQTLAARVTVASRAGLSGIIGDTAFRAIAGLRVQAVGEPMSATTDSSGAFYMPLKPGKYLVRVDGDGFERQTVGVSIPENEGRQVALWMTPTDGPSNNIEGQSLFDMGQRKVRASPATTRFLSRDELESQGVVDLLALARRWSTGQITVDCSVVLGGTATKLTPNGQTAGIQVPISQLMTADVEFVEVYLPKAGGFRGPTSINSMQTTITIKQDLQPTVAPECGNVTLIVWLRK